MGLNLKASVVVEGKYTGTPDAATPEQDFKLRTILNFVDGITAGKADRFYTKNRQLAASASESLDLAATLLDAFGAAITFAKVNLLYVAAAKTNVNDVVIGGAATNGFITPFGAATDKIKVRPGGVLLLACDAGYVVTPGTGDLLQVANSAAGSVVNYTIGIAGRSA